ncbi:MAG: precorrin-2 C(20)-methyltransferase [Breznakibacter sp.]
MIHTHPLTGVGIGPGDPELITVKGLKALQQADVVYYPASRVSGHEISSFSKRIIDHYGLHCPCKPLLFPMTSHDRQHYYHLAYQTVKADVESGSRVVVVSEGDLLFYSTFGYLLQMAKADGIPCHLVPGIPAFIHGASIGQLPLVDEDRSITVLARPKSFVQVEQALQRHDVVVVMKMTTLRGGWADFVRQCRRPFFYIEKAGTDGQFFTDVPDELAEREIPYFSLIVFR